MTIYFVDSINGNDGQPGNSMLWPWRTSEKVASWIFFPSDQILFKGGGEYSRLVIPSAGASGIPILFGMYGYGPNPLFIPSGDNTDTIHCDMPHIDLRNLGVHVPDVPNAEGVHIGATAVRNKVKDLIIVGTATENTTLGMRARAPDAILIENDISKVTQGINFKPSLPGVPASGLVSRNTIHNLDSGNPESGDAIVVNGSSEPDCSGVIVSFNDLSGFGEDGVDLWECHGVIVEHNFIHDPDDRGLFVPSALKGLRGKGAPGGENTFRYNIIVDIVGNAECGGLALRVGPYKVYGNYIGNLGNDVLFPGNESRGLVAWKNAEIEAYENVFVDMQYGIYCARRWPPASMTEWDNVFRTTIQDVKR